MEKYKYYNNKTVKQLLYCIIKSNLSQMEIVLTAFSTDLMDYVYNARCLIKAFPQGLSWEYLAFSAYSTYIIEGGAFTLLQLLKILTALFNIAMQCWGIKYQWHVSIVNASYVPEHYYAADTLNWNLELEF